jgi:hypothetical protein
MLGEVLLKIKSLHRTNSVLGRLKENWMQIIENHDMKPVRFFKGTLTISTKAPIIYVMHLSEEIKDKSNKILSANIVLKVTFITWKS